RPKADFKDPSEWAAYRRSQRETSLVQSIQSSNAIEGIIAPVDRIRSIVLDGQIPRNHTEEEIAGYSKALESIHENDMNIPVSTGEIRRFHQQVYSVATGRGGSWKTQDNKIALTAPDGSVRQILFEPVSAFDTPS